MVLNQKTGTKKSLTHDSIIVQIPFLPGQNHNRLERLLSVFDQEFCLPGSEHYREIDEEHFGGKTDLLVRRLLQAAATPEVRRAMEIEDEILSEIEDRDTTIMVKNQLIEQKEQVIRSMVQMLC